MGAKLWIEDRNLTEEGHNVYRSTSPMDPNNMPAPYDANLPANLTEWEDGAMTPGTTYYYRVGAFTAGGTVELISDELELEAVQPPYPAAALITHYAMEAVSNGSLVDSMGNVPGELFGTAQLTSDASLGSVLSLTNSSSTSPTDYVVSENGELLATLTITSVVWFKTTDTRTFYLWSQRDDGNGGTATLDSRGVALSNGEAFGIGRRDQSSNNYEDTAKISGLADNNWHMMVFQQEGNVLRLFIDGSTNVREHTMASSISAENWGQSMIGARSDSNGANSGGTALYKNNRNYARILSAQEIDQLFTQHGGA